VNKKDSLALTRIINTPARGVGTTSLRKLEDEAVRLQLSLFELIEKIVECPGEFKHLSLSGKVQSAIHQLVHLVQEVQLLEERNHSPTLSYEKLLNESGYYEFLRSDKSYEGAARLENLEELMSAVKQFEESETEPSLVKFLETITLDTSIEEAAGNEQVSLMTVHGSKGLEYPYVFLIGIEENIFPSYKSLEVGPTAIEEERRLFYVAMTRAMKQLTITFAQGRMLWGSLKFNGPSQFLQEIPSQYYMWNNYQTSSKKFEYAQTSYDDFDQTSPSHDDQIFYREKVYQQKKVAGALALYPSGSKIVHALYGSGTVLDSEGLGQDEKVTIQFRDGMRKKFMVKFAPLQKA
jgi:DNA helicase-2/ATP-dependent DNA helicase PcrA